VKLKRRTPVLAVVVGLLFLSSFFIFRANAFTYQADAQKDMPVITIHARQFQFAPAEITLKKGQSTRLVLIADDVDHGLSVEGLGIDMVVSKDHTNEVVVTPEKAGVFQGACSRYCGPGHSKMTFVIHVEP
jgi:cytochrome c oxidase subunit 2